MSAVTGELVQQIYYSLTMPTPCCMDLPDACHWCVFYQDKYCLKFLHILICGSHYVSYLLLVRSTVCHCWLSVSSNCVTVIRHHDICGVQCEVKKAQSRQEILSTGTISSLLCAFVMKCALVKNCRQRVSKSSLFRSMLIVFVQCGVAVVNLRCFKVISCTTIVP